LRSNSLTENNIYGIIDKHITLLRNSGSIEKHFDRWRILGVKLPFNSFVGKSHQEEIDFLKSWIRKRLTWMDSEIGKL
jgi:hypothetical protein